MKRFILLNKNQEVIAESNSLREIIKNKRSYQGWSSLVRVPLYERYHNLPIWISVLSLIIALLSLIKRR